MREGKVWRKEEDFFLLLPEGGEWVGMEFCFGLMFRVCNSGTIFSGLFSKLFLDD